jgi:hypothetical protein
VSLVGLDSAVSYSSDGTAPRLIQERRICGLCGRTNALFVEAEGADGGVEVIDFAPLHKNCYKKLDVCMACWAVEHSSCVGHDACRCAWEGHVLSAGDGKVEKDG